MPKRPQKLPKAAWLYIGLLTLVVIVLWSFFWEKEFNLPKSNNKSFSAIIKDFTNSINEGKEAINRISESVKNAKEGGIPANLVDQFSEKANQKLWQNRVAGWQMWQGENFSFKLPPGWNINEEAGQIMISNFDPALSIKPVSRIAIELTFLNNQDGLTPEQWWQEHYLENFGDSVVSSGLITLSNIEGQNYIIEADLGASPEPEKKEFILLPFNEQMVEMVIEYFTEAEAEYNIIVEDFKKTIEFYTS